MPTIVKLLWVILFLILGYTLWMEHYDHIVAYLPTLLLIVVLLLCPLMHIFMHRGHNDHKNKNDQDSDKNYSK